MHFIVMTLDDLTNTCHYFLSLIHFPADDLKAREVRDHVEGHEVKKSQGIFESGQQSLTGHSIFFFFNLFSLWLPRRARASFLYLQFHYPVVCLKVEIMW